MSDAEFLAHYEQVQVIAEKSAWPNSGVAYLSVDGSRAFLDATETRAVIAALQATLPAPRAFQVGDMVRVVSEPRCGTDQCIPISSNILALGDVGKVTSQADSVGDLRVRVAGRMGSAYVHTSYVELVEEEPEDVEKSATAGTLRLDLRLFLGDRDITYALANPIADALEG